VDADVLVVGAGPAGLAVAACAQRKGLETLVLDRGSRVGETWSNRYDRLHLHTPRVQSALPGMRMPSSYGRWVAKDDVADYLERYARYHAITPRFGTAVLRLDREPGHWTAATTTGTVTARQVVFATGYAGSPLRPEWPGHESFAGTIVHATDYRRAAPFAGQDVLVVGAGNSGAEIAADLAENGAGRVRLAVRTPPNVIPRQMGPLPTTLAAIPMEYSPAWLVDPINRLLQKLLLGDLSRYGLPAPRDGVVAQARATGLTPTIDVGLVAALRAGTVTPVAALERFDRGDAVLADGTRFTPAAVIAATGYSTGLAPAVGHLGVLDERGRPIVHGTRTSSSAPGMRFVGLTNPLKGQLLQIGLDARAIARAAAKELRAA
jgi:glycine/D-amino acid oxidase-like deaminating enzyme